MRYFGLWSVLVLVSCLNIEIMMMTIKDNRNTTLMDNNNLIEKFQELETNYSIVYAEKCLWERLYHKTKAENFKLLVEKILPPKLSLDLPRAKSLIGHLCNIYLLKRSMEYLTDSAVGYEGSKLEELYQKFQITERADADDRFRMCIWSLLNMPVLSMHHKIKDFLKVNNLTEFEFCYSIMEAYSHICAEIHSGRILLNLPSNASEVITGNKLEDMDRTVHSLTGLTEYQQLAVKLLYKAFKSERCDDTT